MRNFVARVYGFAILKLWVDGSSEVGGKIIGRAKGNKMQDRKEKEFKESLLGIVLDIVKDNDVLCNPEPLFFPGVPYEECVRECRFEDTESKQHHVDSVWDGIIG